MTQSETRTNIAGRGERSVDQLSVPGLAGALPRVQVTRHSNCQKFVGNGLWCVNVIDPDGYSMWFNGPTDAPGKSELQE